MVPPLRSANFFSWLRKFSFMYLTPKLGFVPFSSTYSTPETVYWLALLKLPLKFTSTSTVSCFVTGSYFTPSVADRCAEISPPQCCS